MCSFRHDHKNLLASLSQQADEGKLDALRSMLSELDADFDRNLGEKIQLSTQIGNLRIPQVRSLLLSKLNAESPCVEIILSSQNGHILLRVSNPYTNLLKPGKCGMKATPTPFLPPLEMTAYSSRN